MATRWAETGVLTPSSATNSCTGATLAKTLTCLFDAGTASQLHSVTLYWLLQYDWGKERDAGSPSDFKGVAASRHLYETVLRTCIAEVENLEVQTGAYVTGVDYDAIEKRVTGKIFC